LTDDVSLLERARAGELPAWQELLERFGGMVFKLAFQMSGSRSDAEDIAQEVFLKIHRSAAGFRGEAKLSSWIYRIAVNTCIEHRKRRHPAAMELRADMDSEDPGQPGGPDVAAESRLMRERIERALNRLSGRERAVFVLRHYDDLPLRDIASILNVRPGTVKTLLFRALEKLQAELAFYRSEE
jgi:RNA polymerase sigma-70 factor (ECF subfamily)